MYLFMNDFLPGLTLYVCCSCNLMTYDWRECVMGVYMAPQNILSAIVLALGNKVV